MVKRGFFRCNAGLLEGSPCFFSMGWFNTASNVDGKHMEILGWKNLAT